jgi:hypothetical protein
LAKGRKTGGRRAGTPNKIGAEVRAAILDAFLQAGGSSYLVRVANENPAVFCALLGKILPTETAADEPITHEVVLKWMTPEMAKARGLVGPAEKMTTHEIGQQINRRGYDAPDIVDAVPPPNEGQGAPELPV